jgi:hypothetical protein
MTKTERLRPGVLLSGPHGIGKSVILLSTYLMCVVRELPVLYVPSCTRAWTSAKTEDEARSYFMECFFEQNCDLILKDERLRPFFSEQFEGKGNVDPNNYVLLSQAIQEGNAPKCGFIVDEVQRLTEAAQKEGKSFFLSDFTRWDDFSAWFPSMLGGSRLNELMLPSGEEHRLRFIQPFSKPVTECLLTNDKSPFYISNQTESFIRHVIKSLGGMSQDLCDLKVRMDKRTGTDMWVNVDDQIRETLSNMVFRYYIDYYNKGNKTTIEKIRILHCMNNLLHHEDKALDRSEKPFYDSGFIYKDSVTGHVFPVSQAAEFALEKIIESETPRTSENGDWRNFKQQLFNNFIRGPWLTSVLSRPIGKKLHFKSPFDNPSCARHKNLAFFLSAEESRIFDGENEIVDFLVSRPIRKRILWKPRKFSHCCDGIISPASKKDYHSRDWLLLDVTTTDPLAPQRIQKIEQMLNVTETLKGLNPKLFKNIRFRILSLWNEDYEHVESYTYEGNCEPKKFYNCFLVTKDSLNFRIRNSLIKF